MPVAEVGCISVIAGVFVGIEWLLILKKPNLAAIAAIASAGIAAAIFSGFKVRDYLREKRGGNRFKL